MFRRSTPKGPNHRDAFFEEYRKRDQRRKVSLIVSGLVSLLAIGGIFFYDEIARVSSSLTDFGSDSPSQTNWTTESTENPTPTSEPIAEEETPVFTPQEEAPEQIADNFTPEPVVEEEDPFVEEPQVLPPPPAEGPAENTSTAITRGSSSETSTELAAFEGGEKVYKMADKMPNYPGGLSARKRYVRRNMNPTISASVDNSTRTKVYLQFVVEPSGEITSIRVVQGINQQVNQEAIRLIEEMPRWEPGRIDGERVRVYYTIPIDFKRT